MKELRMLFVALVVAVPAVAAGQAAFEADVAALVHREEIRSAACLPFPPQELPGIPDQKEREIRTFDDQGRWIYSDPDPDGTRRRQRKEMGLDPDGTDWDK